MRQPAPAAATTWRQRLLLIVVGGALVGALEVALRLAGFGGAPRLLLPVEPEAAAGSRLYQLNPALAEPFFTRPGRRGEPLLGGHRGELVRVPKPPGTARVVLLGDSTAEGFPLPRNLTAARFLEERLREAAGERPVEVINLGVTAVASFPVRAIGRAALEELEPDLLIVYSGHNEFFGAGGVASWQRMGTRSWVLRAVYALRRSASFQAASALLGPRRTADAGPPQLMEAMAAVERIEPDGPLHRAAERLLAVNVEALVVAARRLGVPVVVSTLVANERDLAPLASFEEGTTRSIADRLAEAQEAAGGNPRAALEALRRLEREAPRHAGVAFTLARALEAAGDAAAAAERYRRARDLDALPWRASRRQSEVLRQVAARGGAVVADAEARFDEAAKPVPGWDLFFDHLHPNLRGQALLAETLFGAIVDHRMLPLAEGAAAPPIDWQQAAGRLGANELEHYRLLGQMGAFFQRGPLAPNNAAAAQHFSAAAQRLLAGSDPLEHAAIERWRAASHDVGHFLPISWFGGVAALAAGETGRAAGYLRSAAAAAPPLTDERAAALLLGAAARARSNPDDPAWEAARETLEDPVLDESSDSAVRLRARAGLLMLAGAADEAMALDARAESLARDLSPLERIYFAELPPARDLATNAAGPTRRCFVLALATYGRPGHGASVDLHTATHRLIRHLDRILGSDDVMPWLHRARIQSMTGGPAINVKPSVARAEVEIEVAAAWNLEAVRSALEAALGRESTTLALAPTVCAESAE